MRTLNQILIITSLAIFLSSCQGDQLTPIDETSKISMEIERTNSNDDFISKVQDATVNEKSSSWRENTNGTIQLIREVLFDLTLENGQNVAFGFWFIKREVDKSLLILEEGDQPNKGVNWGYISSETEASDFYQGFDEVRILVNSNGLFYNETNENFQITKIKTVKIDDEEKSQLTIKFDRGIAYGWYDPMGKFQEVYTFSNGVFKGVIE